MIVGTVQTTYELCLKKDETAGFIDNNIEPEAIFGFVSLLEHHLSQIHKGLEDVQGQLNPGV